MRPHPRPFSCMTSHRSLHFNAAQVHFTTFCAALPECALFANMAIFTLVSFFKAHRDEIQRKFDALRDSCAVRNTHSLFIWTSSHPHQFHQCGNIICDERERDWWMDGRTDRQRKRERDECYLRKRSVCWCFCVASGVCFIIIERSASLPYFHSSPTLKLFQRAPTQPVPYSLPAP